MIYCFRAQVNTTVPDIFPKFYTAFNGYRRIASGPLDTVALVVKQAIERGESGGVLIFDDSTGRSVDIDTRGSNEEVVARLAKSPATSKQAEAALPEHPDHAAPMHAGADAGVEERRGRGRPKLGVVPREVTLLPRHWEWLATQPGGASVALRKLVEEARRIRGEKDRRRVEHERAYHFMSAMAGNMPGFEEATRALFASDEARFRELIRAWPDDVRNHTIALAFGEQGKTFSPIL